MNAPTAKRLTGLVAAVLAAGCLRVARDGETPLRLALMDAHCGDWWRAMKPIEPSGACDAWLGDPSKYRVMIAEFNAMPTRPIGIERLEQVRAEVLEIMDGFIWGYREGLEGGGELEGAEGRGALWMRAYREGVRFGTLERGMEGEKRAGK